MSVRVDPWTGKPLDRASDFLPSPNGHKCDDCGADCIDRCLMCGAPQCCPACCIEESDATAAATLRAQAKDQQQ